MHPLKKLPILLLALFALLSSCEDEDTIVLPENRLTAVAGQDLAVLTNSIVHLDGSLSSDGNGKPFSFEWSFVNKPDQSAATIVQPTTAKPTFSPDKAGTYTIKVTLRQERFTASDIVVITAQENSNDPVEAILHGQITTDRVLVNIFTDPARVDYRVIGDVTVSADLTIMPGVVIAFEQNTGLTVRPGASILSRGTETAGITFRSYAGTPSYWKGILIDSNSERNEFSFTTITEAGSVAWAETGIRANLTITGTGTSAAGVKLASSRLERSGGAGLYIQGSGYLNQFSGNHFMANGQSAIRIPANQLHMLDNASTFAGNGFNGVETGGAVEQAGDVVWKKLNNAQYLISSELGIKSGVTIEAGATFKIKDGLSVLVTEEGFLNASGTANAKITLTSTGPSAWWNGIFFNTTHDSNRLIFAEVSFAGKAILPGMSERTNVGVGPAGTLKVENSWIRYGGGYGVIASFMYQVNETVVSANFFEGLQKGLVLPRLLTYPDRPSLEGEWVDQWSLNKGYTSIAALFYNQSTGSWFEGASDPWKMTAKGMGIRISSNGEFVWTIAENSPPTGCVSYSAEFIKGTVSINDETIVFDQEYWRSKFTNSCDASGEMDIEVDPGQFSFTYEFIKHYNLFSGELLYWEVKFTDTASDNTFSYYRK